VPECDGTNSEAQSPKPKLLTIQSKSQNNLQSTFNYAQQTSVKPNTAITPREETQHRVQDPRLFICNEAKAETHLHMPILPTIQTQIQNELQSTINYSQQPSNDHASSSLSHGDADSTNAQHHTQASQRDMALIRLSQGENPSGVLTDLVSAAITMVADIQCDAEGFKSQIKLLKRELKEAGKAPTKYSLTSKELSARGFLLQSPPGTSLDDARCYIQNGEFHLDGKANAAKNRRQHMAVCLVFMSSIDYDFGLLYQLQPPQDEAACDMSKEAQQSQPNTSNSDAPVRIVDIFAGIGAFLAAFARAGGHTDAFLEWEPVAHAVLKRRYPDAQAAGDFYHEEWTSWHEADVVSLGFECRPFTLAGMQQGIKDSRSSQLSDVAALVQHVNATHVLAENVTAMLKHAEVLKRADVAYEALGFSRILTQSHVHSDLGGASIRDRTFFVWEKKWVTNLLPPFKVEWQSATKPEHISKHLVDASRVPERAYLNGEITRKGLRAAPSSSSPTRPLIIARIQWNDSVLQRGSKVELKRDNGVWRVMEVKPSGKLLVMYTSSRTDNRKQWVWPHAIARRMHQTLDVYSIHGLSKSIRGWGEWPVGVAQLILVETKDGERVRRLLPEECFSINGVGTQSCHDAANVMGCEVDNTTEAQDMHLYRLAGSSIPSVMLQPLADALISRVQQARTAAQGKAAGDRSPADSIKIKANAIRPSINNFVTIIDNGGQENRLDEKCNQAGPRRMLMHLVVASTSPDHLGQSRLPKVLVPGKNEKALASCFAYSHTDTNESKETSIKRARERLAELGLEALHDQVYHGVDFEVNGGQHRVLILATNEEPKSNATWLDIATLQRRLDATVALFAAGELLKHSNLEAAQASHDASARAQALCQHTGRAGALAPQAAAPSKMADAEDADAFLPIVQKMEKWHHEMQQALLGIAEEDEHWKCPPAYLHEWAEVVSGPPLSAIPDELRRRIPKCNDPSLDVLSFTDTYKPAKTDWMHKLPRQERDPGFCPTRISDILTDEALALLTQWAERALIDLKNYRDMGPQATRSNNWVLAIGQNLFHPQARGKVFDLRNLDPEGVREIPLLDFHEDAHVTFNKEFLAQELAKFPDQELLSFMLGGVIFKADLELQLVMLPHLLSLANGFASVETELKRLQSKGWYEFFANIPFIPCRCQPQGSVPRKLEDRWRRILNGGAPHKKTLDTAGRPVVPLNEAAKMNFGDEYISKECRQHNTAKRQLCSKWPKELKPKVADLMHDNMVLRRVADMDDEPCFVFGDDLKDWFHQFRLAAQEFWKVCIFFLALDESHTLGYSFAAEYCLAMGLFMSSGIAQRAANMIMDTFTKYALIDEDRHKHELTTSQAAWLKGRRDINARLRQDRLFACCMYTDDSNVQVVGVARTVRLLKVWHWVTRSMGLQMAHYRKRHIGTGIETLGAYIYLALGLTIFPEHKVVAALAALRLVILGELNLGEYRKLLGLLEHFIVLAASDRSCMHGVYQPLSLGQADTGDTFTITNWIVRKMNDWRHRLLQTPGCPNYYALPTFKLYKQVFSRFFYLYSDAALQGADIPALGGYWHGNFWSLPLTAAWLLLPIPHLEFLALCFNIILFVRHILIDYEELPEGLKVVANADGLAAVQTLTGSTGKSEVMWYIDEWFASTPEYKTIATALDLAHVYGMGNPLGDACSRGYFSLLKAMCAQMNVTPKEIQLPADLKMVMHSTYAQYKLSQLPAEAKARLVHHEQSVVQSHEACLGPRLSDLEHRAPSAVMIRLLSPTEQSRTTAFSTTKNKASQPEVTGGFINAITSQPAPAPLPRSLKRSRPMAQVQGGFIDALHHSTGASTGEAMAAPTSPRRQVSQSILASVQISKYVTSSTQAQASRMLHELQHSTHPEAPNPVDWADTAALLTAVATTMQHSGAASTRKKDEGWRVQYWEPFRLKHRLPEYLSHRPTDQHELKIEATTLALYFMHVANHMKPRSHFSAAAKPDSVSNVVGGLKRIHSRRSFTFSKDGFEFTAKALNGLKQLYLHAHGQDSLKPKRKQPFPGDLPRRLRRLLHTAGRRLGPRVIDRVSPMWLFLHTMMLVMEEGGFRKAEVCATTLNSDQLNDWFLMRSNVTWYIAAAGGLVVNPTPQQLASLAPGDYAMISPPPMKNDQFGEKFGAFPVYLKWERDLANPFDNAASALALIELRYPISESDRLTTPLFASAVTTTQGPTPRFHMTPFSEGMLNSLLNHMLRDPELGLSDTEALKYSWHSYRITLACKLLHNGVDDSIIQRICRWETSESIKVYGRLKAPQYMDIITAAKGVRLDSISAEPLMRRMPQLDEHVRWHDAFGQINALE
jgi:site-specific DNA-cytosine methylase